MKRIIQLVSCYVCILIILYPCIISTANINIVINSEARDHQLVEKGAPTSINQNPNKERAVLNIKKGQEERMCLETTQENKQRTNQTQSKTSRCKIWMIIVLILIGLGLVLKYSFNLKPRVSDLSITVSDANNTSSFNNTTVVDIDITTPPNYFVYRNLESLKKCMNENSLLDTDILTNIIDYDFKETIKNLSKLETLEIYSLINNPNKIRKDIKSILINYKSSINNDYGEDFNDYITKNYSVLKCILNKNQKKADFKILFEQYVSSHTTFLDMELASMLQNEFDIKSPKTGKNILLNKKAELYLKNFIVNSLSLLNEMLVVDSEGEITRVRTLDIDKTSMAIFHIKKDMLLFIKELKKNLTFSGAPPSILH
ncbi:hypothetical protein NECID01_2091 [Nematocida sp. AWRm77]|nr:hypothetical protein NECID01_2091 [Nematocida sp. AWRm77]